MRIGDGCQIGHQVVFATIDHDIDPAHRHDVMASEIVLERNVWVGSHATILRGGGSCRHPRRPSHDRRGRGTGKTGEKHPTVRLTEDYLARTLSASPPRGEICDSDFPLDAVYTKFYIEHHTYYWVVNQRLTTKR